MTNRTCSTVNGVHLERVVLLFGEDAALGKPEKETAVILLRGRVRCDPASAELGTRTLKRSQPFDEPALGLYLPAGETANCTATSEEAEILVADAPAPLGTRPAWLAENEREQRGQRSWAREVGTLLAPPVSARMLLGETVARDGNWSTYPPHKHEVSDLPRESSMQEVFCFLVRPHSGFGLLLTYGATVADGNVTILTNGTMAAVNRGHHAVAAGGGYDLYYLWAAAGEDKELTFRTDPAHAWLLEPQQ
ncbi:5-deoxy-glucuronate isomerase [Streptomyces radiopugnans]|uniref:5-deoxy-glucuronate isomerase n=1 Tax=Streptomyces radiopugnans TaxID=403935 RepID=UPI003F1CD051